MVRFSLCRPALTELWAGNPEKDIPSARKKNIGVFSASRISCVRLTLNHLFTVAGRKRKLAQTHFRTVTVKLEGKSGFASKSNRTLIKTGRTVIVKLEGLAAPTDEDFTCLDPPGENALRVAPILR